MGTDVTKPMPLVEAIDIALEGCKNGYARTYLESVPQALAQYGVQGVKTQLLYALNNMTGWRGETAREIKKVLRGYAK